RSGMKSTVDSSEFSKLVSPCTPRTIELTLATGTLNFLASSTRRRSESNEILVPITPYLWKPDNSRVKVVKIYTVLAETTNTPLNPDSTTCSTMLFKILTFLATKSSLVSPGFLGTPAVITQTSASLASLYSAGWISV